MWNFLSLTYWIFSYDPLCIFILCTCKKKKNNKLVIFQIWHHCIFCTEYLFFQRTWRMNKIVFSSKKNITFFALLLKKVSILYSIHIHNSLSLIFNIIQSLFIWNVTPKECKCIFIWKLYSLFSVVRIVVSILATNF